MTGAKMKLVSFLAGIIATFFEAYGLILALVCIAIVFDVVTGVVASKATGEQLSSKKAYQGFWKKIGLILALFFGVFMDSFIPVAMGVVSITIPFNMPFGLIFGCYIVFNELISVSENLYKIDPGILPGWVIRLLEEGLDKIGKDDSNADGKEQTD